MIFHDCKSYCESYILNAGPTSGELGETLYKFERQLIRKLR